MENQKNLARRKRASEIKVSSHGDFCKHLLGSTTRRCDISAMCVQSMHPNTPGNPGI